MKPIEYMQGFGTFLADELEIGLPHVRADKYDFRNDLLAHRGEEPLEGLDGSLFADPEQAGDAYINLINQRQVLVTFGILDFIDADRVDLNGLGSPRRRQTIHLTKPAWPRNAL
jgi:hypothetical protein